MSEHWDKKLTGELVALGIDWEKARMAVGIIAEQRQQCYIEGYNKGYDDGYAKCQAEEKQ